MSKLKFIYKAFEDVEITIDDKPVELKYLTNVKIEIPANEPGKLTLEYLVRDATIEHDDVVLKDDE